jgi:hypothetical protein
MTPPSRNALVILQQKFAINLTKLSIYLIRLRALSRTEMAFPAQRPGNLTSRSKVIANISEYRNLVLEYLTLDLNNW